MRPHTRPAIALFLPDLTGGGAQAVFVRLANRWVDAGEHVELVIAATGGELGPRLAPSLRLVELGASRTRHAVPALAAYLRRTRPRLLLTAMEHANSVAWAANGLAGHPSLLVCSAHQLVSPALDRRGWTHRIARRVYAAPYRRADGVIAVSRAVADDVSRATGIRRSNIQVIPNPLDLRRIRALSNAPGATLQGPRPRFVAAGRLEPVKDHETLLRAFARVHASRGGSLTLFGQGSQRARLMALIRELGLTGCVNLPGFAQNPYPAYADADALVLTSIREGFGLVLAEAMALGTQVVTTDAPGGALEVLSGPTGGHVGRVGDPASVAEAMLRALDAPVAVHDLRRRVDHLDDHRIAGQYLSYLHDLEQGTPHPGALPPSHSAARQTG